LSFELFFGCDDAGADGLVFVLQQNNTNIGVSGGGMGYGGIVPSLGVEFDTYENTASSDLADDHIAIQQNGNLNHATADNLSGPVTATATSANIEDCAYHDVEITWNPTTMVFEVYFDGDLRISYTGDIVNNIFGGNPTVYWGVTAATGGYYNEHRVRVKKLDYIALEDDTICIGDTISITAPLSGVTYNWSPASSLDNPNAQSPNFFPTATTQYTLELISSAGCSSFDTMTIYVNPVDSTFETITSCNPSDTGYVTTPYLNQYGCDSLHTVYTQLIPTAFNTIDTTTCDSIQLVSNWYFANTSFNDTLIGQAANGCDSIITYNVTINYSTETFDTVIACDSAMVNGNWYFNTQSLTFSDTTVNGCDSTHYVDVTINYSTETYDTIVACDSANVNGTWYFTSQPVTINDTTIHGCDSTHYVDVTINYSTETFDTIVACDSAMVNGNWYFTSQPVTINDTTIYGCDSTHYVDVTINYSTETFDTVVACDSANVNGNWYFNTQSLTFNDTTIHGCDSTHYVDITINYSTATSENITECDSANINGTWYFSSQAITINDTTIYGCDSTHTVNLTINNSSTFTDEITACDSYTWIDGNTYTSSNNTATHTILNANGCDSTITLNLTINYSVSTTDTIYTCFASNVGENVSSTILSNGCDSTHTQTVLLYDINFGVIPDEVSVNSGTDVPYYIDNDNGHLSFGWIASDGTACESDCAEFEVSPTEIRTYYYFTITDDTTGCIVSDTMIVNLIYNSAFNVPNIFTPNGDGENDIYRCYGEDIVEYQLEIFDRWGGRMFITNILTEGWDGVFNGLPVESGIYMAVIRAAGADGQKYEIVQKIKLVR
ncbi:MAG: gliding motility-associated C-terminal domain-containing protein, partial [Chitinophagales bacterium]